VSNSSLASPQWRQTVFTVGDRDYSWLDVFLSAMLRGDWQAFEQQLVEGLACAAEAASHDTWPDDGRLDAAARDFRYARNLLTTDETMAWIEGAGLTVEDWTDFLMRRLLCKDWSDRLASLVDEHASSLEVSDGAVAAEGLCSDAFERLAQTLAGRAAVAGQRDWPRLDGGAVEATRRQHSAWLEALDPDDVTRRLTHLAVLESIFAAEARASLTPDALEALVSRNRMDWMRVDLERLSFPSVAAAREAACCVREDGSTLNEVAIWSRQTVHDTRDILERIEPGLREAVLSAGADELIGPVQVGSRYEVAWIVGKTPADLADALVRARAEAAVVEQLVSKAVLTHVRWTERPRAREGE
jgi:hypothetical protein